VDDRVTAAGIQAAETMAAETMAAETMATEMPAAATPGAEVTATAALATVARATVAGTVEVRIVAKTNASDSDDSPAFTRLVGDWSLALSMNSWLIHSMSYQAPRRNFPAKQIHSKRQTV
jgi:hypothetical protein